MARRTFPALLCVLCFCLALRGDDLIPKDGQKQGLKVIKGVIAEQLSSFDTLYYWTLNNELGGLTGILNVPCGSCYRIEFSAHAELDVIRERWKRLGLTLHFELRNSQSLDLNNCFFQWRVVGVSARVPIREAGPIPGAITPQLRRGSIAELGNQEVRFEDIDHIDFMDDDSLSGTLKTGGGFVDKFTGYTAYLAPTLHGFTYEQDGEYNNPNRPFFRERGFDFREIRRVSIPIVPKIPMIRDFKWSQPATGGGTHVFNSGDGITATSNALRANVGFSGEIHGTDLVAGIQVLFCEGQYRDPPSGEDECQQPRGAVEVHGANLLTFTNAVLPSGWWQVFVKTPDAGISGIFGSPAQPSGLAFRVVPR